MINTGPTNAKIYDRCIRLIARFSGCQYPNEAHDALLRYAFFFSFSFFVRPPTNIFVALLN